MGVMQAADPRLAMRGAAQAHGLAGAAQGPEREASCPARPSRGRPRRAVFAVSYGGLRVSANDLDRPQRSKGRRSPPCRIHLTRKNDSTASPKLQGLYSYVSPVILEYKKCGNRIYFSKFPYS